MVERALNGRDRHASVPRVAGRIGIAARGDGVGVADAAVLAVDTDLAAALWFETICFARRSAWA